MRNPLSDKAVSIPWSGIRKFFDVVNEMPDAISLGVGEPDFDTPWHIRDEGIYSLEKGRTFYTSNAGLKELREEIVRYLERRIHVSYDPLREVLITVGGSEGIDMAFRAMLNPGDEVLIPQPSYVSYEPCCVLADGVPVIIELKEENEFRLTARELRDAITPKTKAMILNNPSNPTGMMYSRKELEEIAKVCVEQDIYVICDEIYYHLVYDGEEFVSLASISPEIKERTLLVNGVSKSYAMTGWRIGYVAANDQVSKVIANYLSHCTGSPSSISQKAAVTALTASQESVEVMRKAFERRRDYMVERMNSIEGVSCIKPHGAFYVMMNIEKLIGQELHGVVIRDADDFGTLFLKYGKVAVVPGTGFGAPTFVRWSYATSIENIKEGLNRLERFLKGETI